MYRAVRINLVLAVNQCLLLQFLLLITQFLLLFSLLTSLWRKPIFLYCC